MPKINFFQNVSLQHFLIFFVRCLPRRVNTATFSRQMFVLVGRFTLDQEIQALRRHTPTFNWEHFPPKKKWRGTLIKNTRLLCSEFLTPRWNMSNSNLSESSKKALSQITVPPSPMNTYQLPILRWLLVNLVKIVFLFLMLLFPFSWDGFIYIWHLIICNTTCPMNHWGGERGEGRKSRDMPHYVFFIYQEKCKCLILFISHAAVPFSCKGWVIFIWHLIICNTTPCVPWIIWGEGRGREVKGHALLPKEM